MSPTQILVRRAWSAAEDGYDMDWHQHATESPRIRAMMKEAHEKALGQLKKDEYPSIITLGELLT